MAKRRHVRELSLYITGQNAPGSPALIPTQNKETELSTITVNDGILNSPEAEAYFQRADRRVMIGLRATCEILGVPTPPYAERGKPGVTPAKMVMTAYQADNPQPRPMVLPERKPAASPARVQAVKATNQRRITGLFDQTFPR